MAFLLLANSFAEGMAFQSDGVDWSVDWWKVLILAFGTLLLLFLAIRLALYILRLVGVILCLAFATAGGVLAWRLLPGAMESLLPEALAPFAAPIAAVAGFLVCFGIAAGIMHFIRKPAQPLSEKKD